MPSRLVLVRHARAAPAAGADLLRPLTEDGLRQAQAQGRALAALGPWGPILSSPARRCVETARALGDALGGTEPEITDELAESAPDFSLQAFALRVADRAILVGHQPGLETLACRLLQAARLPVPLAPSTALVVAQAPGTGAWRLEQALPPP